MVFQSYALYPQMTVRRNLGYGLRVRGTPTAELNEAVERVAKILEIDHLLDRICIAYVAGHEGHSTACFLT